MTSDISGVSHPRQTHCTHTTRTRPISLGLHHCAVGAVAQAVEGVEGEAVLSTTHQACSDVRAVGGAQSHRPPPIVFLLVAQHKACTKE